MKLQIATNKALKSVRKALPHIEAARTILAEALGIGPEDRPDVDLKQSSEHWEAVRVLQNVSSAHLHLSDPYGS